MFIHADIHFWIYQESFFDPFEDMSFFFFCNGPMDLVGSVAKDGVL